MPQPPEAVLDQLVADPSTGNTALNDFHELLVIALGTVLSCGQGAIHMAALALAKKSFLCGFVRLEHGLPSHDIFSRLFPAVRPRAVRPPHDEGQAPAAADVAVWRRGRSCTSIWSLPMRRRSRPSPRPRRSCLTAARSALVSLPAAGRLRSSPRYSGLGSRSCKPARSRLRQQTTRMRSHLTAWPPQPQRESRKPERLRPERL